MKDIYNEVSKTLKKEIKEDTKRWKSYHVHGLAEFTFWKWLYYQKQSINSMQFPSKFQNLDLIQIQQYYETLVTLGWGHAQKG
jgi:hypothetical protein